MTREEAIEFGNMWLQMNEDCKDSHTYMFFKMAIKTLEQEPCEDCVSREKVWYMITGGKYSDEDDEQFIDRLVNKLADLPSVTPQPKMGHWIEGQTNNSKMHNILCSCCLEGYPSKGHANSKYTREKFKWCPNCGAYMIGEVEE